MAKMIDVAQHAGVSLKTVSRVVNNEPHVQDALREKVQASIVELGYVPSSTARQLRANRSYSIHLVTHTSKSAYVHAVQFGALQATQKAGYMLIISMVSEDVTADPGLLAQWCRQIVQNGKPDGFILVPPMSNDTALNELFNSFDIPIARVGPNRIEDQNATVTIDDRAAAREATQHLLDLGHNRIGFIRGAEDQDATRERYSGYCDAMSNANLTIDPQLVKNGTFLFESGRVAGAELLSMDVPPTAIFAANDEMAAGVIAAAYRRGINVPNDLSVIGFDDAEIADHVWPPLTTIHQPLMDLGGAAVNALVKLAGGNAMPQTSRQETLPHELIVRRSTAALARSSMTNVTRL